MQWVALKAAPRGDFSHNTIRVWADKGIIETKKVGGRIYVNVESLQSHLAMLVG